jgi:hypothetical protein
MKRLSATHPSVHHTFGNVSPTGAKHLTGTAPATAPQKHEFRAGFRQGILGTPSQLVQIISTYFGRLEQ